MSPNSFRTRQPFRNLGRRPLRASMTLMLVVILVFLGATLPTPAHAQTPNAVAPQNVARPAGNATYDLDVSATIPQSADPVGIGYTIFTGELQLVQTSGGNYKGTLLQYQGQKKYPATGTLSGSTGSLTLNTSVGTFVFATDGAFSINSVVNKPTKLGVISVFATSLNHIAQENQYTVIARQVSGPVLDPQMVSGTVVGHLVLNITGPIFSYIANGTLTMPNTKSVSVFTPVTAGGNAYYLNTVLKVDGKSFFVNGVYANGGYNVTSCASNSSCLNFVILKV